MSAADRLRLQLGVMVDETDAERLLALVQLLDDARERAMAKYNATPQWEDCGRCSTCARGWQVAITPARERAFGIPGECPACWNGRHPDAPPSFFTGQARYV